MTFEHGGGACKAYCHKVRQQFYCYDFKKGRQQKHEENVMGGSVCNGMQRYDIVRMLEVRAEKGCRGNERTQRY